MGRVRIMVCVVVTAVAPLWSGCAADRSTDEGRALTPADFAGAASTQPASQPADAAAPARVHLGAADAGRSATSDRGEQELERALDKLPKPIVVAGAAPGTRPADKAYTLDAMVGQVNGQAIYAGAVFDPLQDQLALLGKSEPRMVFRQRAKELIARRLDEMVSDALILGEAERDLSSQEQQGLQNMLKERREELIKFWGGGSEAVANEQLREKKGKGVEQMLTESRQASVVKRYMQQKLLPKINVTRKDIERYYYDHAKEFNTPPTRTLRVIHAESPAAADRIDALIASDGFAQAAANRLNRYKPAEAGLLIDTSGGEVFGQASLNAALDKLKPGEHSPRVPIGDSFWWVCVDSVQPGQSRSLRQAQLDIEERLRRQRFQSLSQRYRQRLFAEGSYNPLEEMAQSLLQVAMGRYAQPE